MLPLHKILRVLIAFSLSLMFCSEVVVAGTCPRSALDKAEAWMLVGPKPTLTPGIPSHLVIEVTNPNKIQLPDRTFADSNTWYSDASGNRTGYAYRLGAAPDNHVWWGNMSCGGYPMTESERGSITNQRAFLCGDIAPGGVARFEFDVTAPLGASGQVKVDMQMLEESGQACTGWFDVGAVLMLDVSSPTPNEPPPAPTGLSGQAGVNTVTLTWDAVSVATKYNIYQSFTGTNFHLWNMSTTPSYAGTAAAIGRPYYFVVTAVNAAGLESGYSDRIALSPQNAGGGTCTAYDLAIGEIWMIEFFNNPNLQGAPVETRYGDSSDSISLSAIGSSACVGSSGYSVRARRLWKPTQAGDYDFTYRTTDNLKVYFDFQPIIDGAGGQGTVTASASSDRLHEVKVEYTQAGANASMSVGWSRKNQNTPLVKPTGVRAEGQNGKVRLRWDPVNGAERYGVWRFELFQYILWATTNDTSYVDNQVNEGSSYTYKINAARLSTSEEGPRSDPVTILVTPPAQGDPKLTLRIQDGAGNTVQEVRPNADGWPSPNPLKVIATLDCPSNRREECRSAMSLTARSRDGNSRFNGKAEDNQCEAYGPIEASNSTIVWLCPSALPFALLPGESKTVAFDIVVQPSLDTTFDVTAEWGSLKVTQPITVKAAAIHPVIVIPGLLGTMPPRNGTGNFDPILGVYTPLMEQLRQIGYEEEATLFRMPYDWRNSNRKTAAYLRQRIREAVAANKVGYLANDGKVDLIVHSMGGIITRTYVEGEGIDANGDPIPYGDNIRKVIFISTPHRGFPEDYKTYESASWRSFLADTPVLGSAMDNILWPSFVKKHWAAAHPNEPYPVVCTRPTGAPVTCATDISSMTHAPSGGIDSMREMLPTPDADSFFGPYLCQSYNGSTCVGAYPYNGRPLNTLLPVLNEKAHLDLFETLIGDANIYVIYGVEPNPVNNTDVVYQVQPGTPGSVTQWTNGKITQNFVTPAGDDLIPEYSSNLQSLIPNIPDANVASHSTPAGPRRGLDKDSARHKEVMWDPRVQSVYVPNWLTGMGAVSFSQPYSPPRFGIGTGTWYWITGECPVNLLLTDPNGRRLGYDPATGQTFNEIPGSIYASGNSESQFMAMKDLPPGRYSLLVSGFGDGPFLLSLHHTDGAQSVRRWMAEGTVTTGQVLPPYEIVIGPNTPILQRPPVANAGADQTVKAGPACTANVALDGSASYDPDNEPLTYQWTGKFGFATSVRPLVTLPAGVNDIRLVVLDGSNQGSDATVRVKVVDDRPPVVKSLSVTPSILEPADGTLRKVTVTADVRGACGEIGKCRIVAIEGNEGNSDDWSITGALTARLRAERVSLSDGRIYKIRLECTFESGPKLHKTINVKVPPPGRIKGSGKIHHDERAYKFDFDVWESKAGKDSGNVKLEVRRADDDDDDDDDRNTKPAKFRSTGSLTVRFKDDDDFEPGGNAKIDTVSVQGEGEWNGKAGYSFEMRASDDGEPGHGRDRFKIVIRDASGKTVASVSEEIDSGNIQALKPPK